MLANGQAKISGNIKDEKINCNLNLERVVDQRRARSSDLLKVETHRLKKDCNPKLNYHTDRGLEDNIDLIVYKNYSKIYLFETYKALQCDSSSRTNNKKLLKLKPRNINYLAKRRKGKRLELNFNINANKTIKTIKSKTKK